MKMIKLNSLLLASFLLLCLFNTGFSQQNPHLNLYHQDYFMVNPAVAGDGQDINAFFDLNRQWSGTTDAPKTSTFGLHSSYKNYGFGILVMDDQAGMFGKTSANLNYAYKLKISDKPNHFLSFGLGFGFAENSIRFDNAIATDMSDPILAYGNYEGWAFDARFGLNYRLGNYQFGVAIPTLIGNEAQFERPGMEDYTFEMNRHYMLHTGYRISFNGHTYDDNQNKVKGKNEKYYVTPSVLFHFLPNVSEQLDINIIGGSANGYWLGLTARPLTNAFLVSAGVHVMDIGIAYSYEIPGSRTTITRNTSGSHEIMLTYQFTRKSTSDKKMQEDMSRVLKSTERLEQRLDTVESDVEELKARDASGVSKEDLKNLEDKYMDEIEKLRKQLNEMAKRDIGGEGDGSGDGSGSGSAGTRTTIGGGSGNDDNSALGQMRSDLDELSQNVRVDSSKDVVGINIKRGADNTDVVEETQLKDGNYVIIYSFRSLENAKRGVKIGAEKGFEPKILYNKKRKWYYIYVDYYPELKPALLKMENVRKGHYDDSWVHIFRQ